MKALSPCLQAFPRECTESFQEGHKRAFEFFGGVPTRISYDNLKIAVTKITGSRQRELTSEFLRLKSHYLFESHFCLVRRANEKGHVENLVGYCRRNFLVPIPKVNTLTELNEELERRCRVDLDRTLRGKSASKRELLREELAKMLDLPRQAFDARRVTGASANSLSLVQYDTNRYSVPVKYAHRQITIVASVDEVRLTFQGELIARHSRHWGREKHVFDRRPRGYEAPCCNLEKLLKNKPRTRSYYTVDFLQVLASLSIFKQVLALFYLPTV
ncbi:Mu transposase domain-containing protein [Bythopirellula polymerisocia]|uniref:Integrase core domain protein n=1 Tax=Bythopirellula polymerisocia TaxID=2528003 RepID=A0A5C6CB18_9BACT|nr:DDE-type integrase/transposase/recombinase [Bythopirellula polymerisocia]TWU21418.1 Integrase core domain protein [Bythopirellula polymerisocia]